MPNFAFLELFPMLSQLVIVMRSHSRMNDVFLDLLGMEYESESS